MTTSKHPKGFIMKHHLIEVNLTANRSMQVCFYPLSREKKKQDGYRMAGAESWSGYSNIARFDITETKLINLIKNYFPNIIKSLKVDDQHLAGSQDSHQEVFFDLFLDDKFSKLTVLNEDFEYPFVGDLKHNFKKAFRRFPIREYDLYTYIRSYCTPSARKRILEELEVA